MFIKSTSFKGDGHKVALKVLRTCVDGEFNPTVKAKAKPSKFDLLLFLSRSCYEAKRIFAGNVFAMYAETHVARANPVGCRDAARHYVKP